MTVRNVVAIAGTAVLVVAISVGAWFGYWALAGASQSNRYDVNTHSQQYQAALVSQERDRVTAYDASDNDAQKAYIARAFCAAYSQLDPATPDLVDAHARIC